MTVTAKMRRKFPRVPYVAIEFHMGRVHVGTPDEEVRAEMEGRAKSCNATPAETAEIVRYALACHADNRGTYRAVLSGRFG